VQLAAGAMHFRAGFHLVRTLALCSEVLLHGQINGVVIRLDTENFFGEFNRSAGFLSLYV
jgi:hypothetical protein